MVHGTWVGLVYLPGDSLHCSFAGAGAACSGGTWCVKCCHAERLIFFFEGWAWCTCQATLFIVRLQMPALHVQAERGV